MLHKIAKILLGFLLFSVVMAFFVLLRLCFNVSQLVPQVPEVTKSDLATLQYHSSVKVSLPVYRVKSHVHYNKRPMDNASDDDDLELGSFHIRKRDFRYYAFDDELILEMSLSWLLFDLGLEVRLNCKKSTNFKVLQGDTLLVICLNTTHLTREAMARRLTKFEAKLLVLMFIFNKLGGNGTAIMLRGKRSGELSTRFDKFVTSQLAVLMAKKIQEKRSTKVGHLNTEPMKWNNSSYISIQMSPEKSCFDCD